MFLFLAAALLLTGASVAGVVQATTTSVSTTTRDMRAAVQRRRATEELGLEPARRASRAARRGRAVEWEGEDPEAFWSGEERFPDLYDEDETAVSPSRSRAGA